jgi:phosphohistidine phosphatase
MKIYILRHGIAEERRAGRADEKRALTDEGRAKLKLVLKRARSAKVSPSLILTSPYVRAVQTAEMAADVLGCKKKVVRTDALLPSSSSPEAVWRQIRELRNESGILLAGHEPLLSQTASYLLGEERTIVEFKKGALALIEASGSGKTPEGVLRWLLTPKMAGGETEEKD